MKILDIHWKNAVCIASGSYRVVFAVGPYPFYVAKVSWSITPNEGETQHSFAAQHKALAVLDYVQGIRLIPWVHENACSIHGETNAWEDL